MAPLIVAPSLLAADPLNFAAALRTAEEGGAGWHHVDVMDGHFVPNLTFGLPIVAAMKKVAKLPLDVHIMVTNPDQVALDYVRAGADYLVFHVEAAVHAHRLCQAIRQAGGRPGLAINPGTPLETLEPLLEEVDLINVMSVNPGFGGQKFIERAVGRIRRLRQMMAEQGLADRIRIQVDGGINEETGRRVVEAGADTLVAGSYVFGASDPKAAIASLTNLLPASMAGRGA